jgi:hypothetical protein
MADECEGCRGLDDLARYKYHPSHELADLNSRLLAAERELNALRDRFMDAEREHAKLSDQRNALAAELTRICDYIDRIKRGGPSNVPLPTTKLSRALLKSQSTRESADGNVLRGTATPPPYSERNSQDPTEGGKGGSGPAGTQSGTQGRLDGPGFSASPTPSTSKRVDPWTAISPPRAVHGGAP